MSTTDFQPACTVYADRAMQECVSIERNDRIARDTYKIRLHSPAIASRLTPGQFLMVRLTGTTDPLLGRPLAMYDTVLSAEGRPEWIEIVYTVVGKMTRRLSGLDAGQQLSIWGPLGNGFAVQEADHLLMVAGGIGQTPFLSLAKAHLHRQQYGSWPSSIRRVARATLLYGARSADLLAGVDDFRAAGVLVKTITDDGSSGRRGLVTDLLRDELQAGHAETRRVVLCGPEPMLKAVTKMCQSHQVPAQVSLETPMACGIGICFSCVAPLRDASGTVDYHRTCVEGPVFDAGCVAWD